MSDTEVIHQVFHNLYDISTEGDNPKIKCLSNISKSKKKTILGARAFLGKTLKKCLFNYSEIEGLN